MIKNIKVLVELFVSLYCLAELFGKRLKISIHVVILSMVYMFLAVAIDDYGFPKYFISILYICIFLYALAYYGESIKRTLINFFLMAVIMTVVQLISFLPLYFFYFERYEEIDINELLINIICLILIVLLSAKINFKKLSDFFEKRNKLIIGVSVLVLIGIGINFYKMKDIGDIVSEAYIQLMFFFFIFAFVIYEWQKSKVDAEKRKTQLEMNGLYYDAYDQLIMLVRERQHDMKNHINTILSIVHTTDNYDELKEKQIEYCNHVMEGTDKAKLVLSVGNPLIAGFMYSKIQEAENRGVVVEHKINIGKTTVVIPEYELVEMAGILIDNALEAMCGTDEDIEVNQKEKNIFVSMQETETGLELTVANTSDYMEDDVVAHFFEAGYSSKGKGRGIGLYKLKRMVHEKTGDIIVSNETYHGVNYLQFDIRIPLERKSKKNFTDEK